MTLRAPRGKKVKDKATISRLPGKGRHDRGPAIRISAAELERLSRLDLIVENTTNMVVITNAQREIEWVNPAYTRITGWALSEVQGRNPRSFLHGPGTSRSVAERVGSLLRRGGPVTGVELLNYKKSGEPYWVTLDIHAVLDPAAGLTNYVSIQTDITERKLAEQAIAESQRRLIEAQEVAGLGGVEHELESGRFTVSEQFLRIVEAQSGDFEPSYEAILGFVHPEDRDGVAAAYADALIGASQYEREHRIVTRTGRVRWVHARGSVLAASQGLVKRARVVMIDITERKNAERLVRERDLAQRANEAQMSMLSRISHELRTPLHAILGFSDLLERDCTALLPSDQLGRLHLVHQAATHLLSIVNDVLELTSASGDHGAVVCTAIPARQAVQAAMDLLRPMAEARGLRMGVPAGEEFWVRADRKRLHQILINLLGNAIKYNRQGGSVSVQMAPGAGDSIDMAVIDTGQGIAAADMPHLFEPFFKVVRETSSRESSGLGLAVARAFAHSMDGEISVRSGLGTGSCFTLNLPRSDEQAQGTAAPQPGKLAASPVPDAVEPSGTVLYVDDDEINWLVVAGYLAPMNRVTLICKPDGATGLAGARELRPTVILADMELPDMSGLDLLRQVLSDPLLRKIPCLALSGNALDSDVEQALGAGFRAYLVKPAPLEQFLRTITPFLTGPVIER